MSANGLSQTPRHIVTTGCNIVGGEHTKAICLGTPVWQCYKDRARWLNEPVMASDQDHSKPLFPVLYISVKVILADEQTQLLCSSLRPSCSWNFNCTGRGVHLFHYKSSKSRLISNTSGGFNVCGVGCTETKYELVQGEIRTRSKFSTDCIPSTMIQLDFKEENSWKKRKL